LIRQAISQPNWKLTRLSSIDHELLVDMNRPSFVSAISSASVPSPGSRLMFVMRISGRFCHPSARIVPLDASPRAEAVSRLETKLRNIPASITGTRCAGTPSSS
jgi:hypothetical protein